MGDSLSAENSMGLRLRAENELLYTLLEFSKLLTSTRTVDQILEILTVQTSALLGAERTSIFIYDESRKELWSKVAQGEKGRNIRVAANKGIVGLVVRKGDILNVRNAYRHRAFNPDVDRQTGFITRNILACPMRTHTGAITGVMEVLNKKGGSFTIQDEKMCSSIAALAGVALENSFLIESQENLFESFVESSIHALGERDRITYGHTVRVAFYADRIARMISDSNAAPFRKVHYPENVLKKLRYAALLHDIGKIGVPEAVLNKRDKLEPHQVEAIWQRFEQIKLGEHIRLLENGGADSRSHAAFCARLDRDMAFIRSRLTPGPISPDDRRDLDRLRGTVHRIAGRDIAELTEQEHRNLIVSRGNLTDEEFTVMKDHVKKTWDILGKIYWPKDMKEVPVWAATHHERPNGTGYPQGLKGREIPLEGQILAVADIYDALTASDRPYKKRIPIDEAKKIMRQAADAGQINKEIVDLFLSQPLDRLSPPGQELEANRKPQEERG